MYRKSNSCGNESVTCSVEIQDIECNRITREMVMLPALRILRTIHASLVGMARHHPGIAMLLKEKKTIVYIVVVVVFIFNVPPTAKVIWRRSHGLKSHPTDF